MRTWHKDELIAHCIAHLDEDDRAARSAWCRETEEADVAVADDGEALDIWWGGRPLVRVPRVVLVDPDAPVRVELVGTVPDDVRELTGGDPA
ncbi:hypothetical protein [Actinoallomurus sp. CA-150999]|uniref:hypothetical protein n=1 Tax=Actinoallomurus sp. CA-150999 TaxID=3239887 RepID=UPI003D8F0E5E